jgi:hypothetical protein
VERLSKDIHRAVPRLGCGAVPEVPNQALAGEVEINPAPPEVAWTVPLDEDDDSPALRFATLAWSVAGIRHSPPALMRNHHPSADNRPAEASAFVHRRVAQN